MNFLAISLTTSLSIVFVILLRLFFAKRMPRRVFWVLWLLTALQLLIPFRIPLPMQLPTLNAAPVMNFISNQLRFSAASQTMVQEHAEPIFGSMGGVMAPVINSNFLAQTLVTVWLVGMVIVFAFFLINHMKSLKKFSPSLPIEEHLIPHEQLKTNSSRNVRIRQNDQVSIPFTYGIFRPVIIVPKRMILENPDRLDLVLTHEFMHIKWLDYAIKWLMVLCVSVHWFNPLVWLMFYLLNQDIEISCDESVILSIGEMNRLTYAHLLLNAQEHTVSAPLVSLSFTKNPLEKRIKNLIHKRRRPKMLVKLSIVAVFVAYITFSLVACTTPETHPSSSETESETRDETIVTTYVVTDSSNEENQNESMRRLEEELGTFVQWVSEHDSERSNAVKFSVWTGDPHVSEVLVFGQKYVLSGD